MTPRKPARAARAGHSAKVAGSPARIAAAGPDVAAPGAPLPPLGLAIRIALALTLVALLVHAMSYAFLTDDSFISFRYARNLAHGHGLVFNPGGERVEGYSNFLWVLILAGLDRIGLRPEQTAIPLSLLATVGLWWVVVRFVVRHRRPDASPWWVVLPPAFLAVSRSVAVWSTSGLETRLFEFLAVAGLFRLADETDAARSGGAATRPWGATLLGLAALTRPDGALVAGVAILAGAALAGRERRAPLPAWIGEAFRRGWPALLMVAGHYAFRRIYYGAWEPNTYYAKVGGVLRPAAGWEYLETFVLEYAALLWLPPMIMAFAGLARSRMRSWIVIASAALLPHLAYVVAIGGDHFEYRPLTVLFPWVAVLLGEGMSALAAVPRRRPLAVAGSLAILFGAFYLPWRSHMEFPKVYMPGFPGLQISEGPLPDEDAIPANRFLDPDRSWLTRLPGFRQWGEAHRLMIRRITSYYSGIRAEEHRLFFRTIRGEGATIRHLMDEGLLPRDVAMAMDCVGAIPYMTDARVLDRLGLTDAHVAHQPFTTGLVAHGKQATFDYARSRRMDLWFFHPAQLVVPAASSRAMRAFSPLEPGEPGVYVAPLAGDRWLMARLPMGVANARERMPRLHFWDMQDSSDVLAARAAAIAAWEAKLDSLPRDTETLDALGFLYAESGAWARAGRSYAKLAEVTPRDPDPLVNLAACHAELGDERAARQALEDAAARARALGDERRLRDIEAKLAQQPATPGGSAR